MRRKKNVPIIQGLFLIAPQQPKKAITKTIAPTTIKRTGVTCTESSEGGIGYDEWKGCITGHGNLPTKLEKWWYELWMAIPTTIMQRPVIWQEIVKGVIGLFSSWIVGIRKRLPINENLPRREGWRWTWDISTKMFLENPFYRWIWLTVCGCVDKWLVNVRIELIN